MTETILISGANRGIGLQFVRHYLAQGRQVIATCRNPQAAAALTELAKAAPDQLRLIALDICDPQSIALLADSLAGEPLGLLINNAGIYGPKGQPFAQLEASQWMQVMQTNAIAPLLVTQALLPMLLASRSKKVAFISSKMGSIADNGKGGSYLYRASKSALNAAVRSLALDYADSGLQVALLHPGWVKTDMGGSNALISATESVSGMAEIIANMTQAQSGCFYAFDGQEIPW